MTDANKHQFVVLKIRATLVSSRLTALRAIRRGFEQSLMDLSPEAAPFLRLLSSADWRVLLCGEDEISADAVVRALTFRSFPRESRLPEWFRTAVKRFSPDNLRRFLVFATGSASLPRGGFEISVRCQRWGMDALPVAHTCFLHVERPELRRRGGLGRSDA